MTKKRVYRRRGTPDFPVSTYMGVAGESMMRSFSAEYHPEIEIALQVAGTTTGKVDNHAITYHAGDIFLIPGNAVHQRLSISDDAEMCRIIFSTEAITMHGEHFFQKEFVKPLSEGRLEFPTLLQPGHPCYNAVYDAMMRIKDCHCFENHHREGKLLILMQICLALLPYCRIKEDAPVIPEEAPEEVRRCMRYIHDHYREKITTEEIAHYCNLHPSRLTVVFKRFTGQSVFEYLTRFRVETARTLLLREDLSVSQVAELSGFRSECLFYRKFKALMGMPPKAYAKQQKEK